jgi:hypothetical protein
MGLFGWEVRRRGIRRAHKPLLASSVWPEDTDCSGAKQWASAISQKPALPIRIILYQELAGTLFGKPSRSDFIGETMKFEK